jgi:hypothetical protein
MTASVACRVLPFLRLESLQRDGAQHWLLEHVLRVEHVLS